MKKIGYKELGLGNTKAMFAQAMKEKFINVHIFINVIKPAIKKN